MSGALGAIEAKMRAAGVAGPSMAAFISAVRRLQAGETGMCPESAIDPVTSMVGLAAIRARERRETWDLKADGLLAELAVVKLNGGLGTSMGLAGPKSLIPVRDKQTFLDFIARHILYVRAARNNSHPLFFLMNSFTTQQPTLDYLKTYPELWADSKLDFLQARVPKLDLQTCEPVSWPPQPECEWCPPGHGDLYPALVSSGLLSYLLNAGAKYLFVSNADNLGATVDPALLRYFAGSRLSFLMEVCERTATDKKGGHLALRRSDGRLILRELAQCPDADRDKFQDIQRHRFFNTNNLWIRLDHLQAVLDRYSGALPLPLIKNVKPVQPQDPSSPRVLQLESAMGAAIECFERAGAVLVPRSRFAPVKTTADLLAMRSDAYRVAEDFGLVLEDCRRGRPPVINLDDNYYRLLHHFNQCFGQRPPSLIRCDALTVQGQVAFDSGVVCEGTVEFTNTSPERKTAPAGVYRNASHKW